MSIQTIEAEANVPPEKSSRVVFTCPKSTGSGKFFLESFASGLKLMVMDMNFNHPVIVYNKENPHTIGMSFVVKGESQAFSRAYPRAIGVHSGISGYFTFPEPADTGEKILTKQYQRVWVMLEPDTLTKLAHEDEQSFAPFLHGLKQNRFHLKRDSLTSAMGQTAHQILNCPYQGKTRSFFLESKMLELLVCKLEQIKKDQKKGGYWVSRLKPLDRERVRHAAKILEQQMENPPDLGSLGKAVGLNRSKFHTCFCKEFGQSPLEYLRDIRLSEAKKLLEQGRCNVTEASCMVGYSNPSYFSNLFQKRYHLLPGDLLRLV